METSEGKDYSEPVVDSTDSQLVPFNQAVQQYLQCAHQACTAVAVPYGPPPVYNVYNISNPVGIQIQSEGSSMTVDGKDIGKKAEDTKHTATQTGDKSLEGECQRIISHMEILEEEGKWHNYDRFYRKACSHFAENPDILIRIVLENIVAAYYRNDLTDGQQSILRVQELIFQTQDPHHHQAHMLYLKSALFRKEKKYREAENAIVLAQQGLDQLQVGRDTGEIWYNVAALFAQVLNEECTDLEISTSDFQDHATEAFQYAIQHYRQGGEEDESCRNKLRRAHIRHAMSLLGCWSEVRSANRSDDVTEDDLRQAGDSLDEVEKNLWDGIPNRMRYYWHLARSDLFRYRNRLQRALEMAEEALEIAKSSKFPSEVQFAEGRVTLLSKLVSNNSKDRKSDPMFEETFGDDDIATYNCNKTNIVLAFISIAALCLAVCVQYLLYGQQI
uniref:Uncharacterized protein n=1 Tax=Branchiostoma floridae TaxID=7739 RepID=C3YHD2_BRAFL|eukprot:XP_002604357.1 hypothetical protein BRAFLDRAFT_85448 [Branchiostoma floridae]